jgi:hypothetical protein
VDEFAGDVIIDMSGNGRFLAIAGASAPILLNLVSGDSEPLPAGSRLPSLSYDARFVAHIDSTGRVAVLDRQTSSTEVVGLNNAGEVIGLNNWPSVSNDGRYVAFESRAPNIVPGDSPDTPDVFVRDRQAGETILVSNDASGRPSGGVLPQISPSGRQVVYTTSYMVGQGRLLIHDLETGATERVSVNSFGEEANDAVPGVTMARQDLSADGRFVAFESNATNLVDGDTNGTTDIFVHDRMAPTAQRPAPTPAAAGAAGSTPAIAPWALPELGGAPDTRRDTLPPAALIVLAGVSATLAGAAVGLSALAVSWRWRARRHR